MPVSIDGTGCSGRKGAPFDVDWKLVFAFRILSKAFEKGPFAGLSSAAYLSGVT